MNVCVHKDECQNHDVITPYCQEDPVHAILKIDRFIENGVRCLPFSGEMPAVFNIDCLPFDERDIDPEIRYYLPQFVFTYSHNTKFFRLKQRLAPKVVFIAEYPVKLNV